MNFNLALIYTDGRFTDARALCASYSPTPPPHHRPIWEESSGLRLRSLRGSLQLLLVQRYQPGASTPTHPCLERPKMPRKWAGILEMDRLNICGMDEEDPKFLRPL